MSSELEAGLRGGRMGRRDFLALLGLGAAGLMSGEVSTEAISLRRRRPNIIVILADDLGYADLGCQGGRDIATPYIDSLAENGVRFTNGYASSPLCSPTRAGLLTGRYQQRFGHEFNLPASAGPTSDCGLPVSQLTMARLLRRAGYRTAAVGKWHLGMAPKFHPLKRGFDEFFGFLHAGHPYLDGRIDGINPILRGTEPVVETQYLTDAFTREAVAFINRHPTAPFFLYLAYNAVHTPLEAPKRYLDRFRKITDEKRRTYAAMLGAMDDGVGAVLRALKNLGLYRDTMVFFLSDNGGDTEVGSANNRPLTGSKGTLAEGGIRVPFILQWPRILRGGRIYEHPVISLDVLPTAIAAAGGKLPTDRTMDGVNLIPYLTPSRGTPHETLFWRMDGAHAVRRGNWKLRALPREPPRLYDLAHDAAETKDLAQKLPAVAKNLALALFKWELGLSAPLWGDWRPGGKPPARRVPAPDLRTGMAPRASAQTKAKRD